MLGASGSLELVEVMRSLDEFATAKLDELDRSRCAARLVDTTRVTGIWLLRNGRRLLSFSCNDYLNLTHHPAVKDAAIAGAAGLWRRRRRIAAGDRQPSALRRARSPAGALKGTEAACVFGSGYLANLRHHPGARWARRSHPDRRTVACVPVGGRAAVAGDRHALPALRRRPCRGTARRTSRAPSPRPDDHRRRLLDGWRRRATLQALRAGAARTTPG